MADSLLPQGDDQLSEREELFNKWKDKTKEEILEAKINADLFIKTRNAQFDDLSRDHLKLREEQQTSAQLQDLIRQLEGRRQDDTSHTPPRDDNVSQQTLKPEDIESLVAKKLTEHQINQKQQENLNAMLAKLKDTFGDNYPTVYKQRLQDLGLDAEFADNLAKTHPSVFMKTFGLDQPRQTQYQNLPRTSQRADSFAPKTEVRDWNYYQNLKKTDPKIYLDPKIQVQMHNDLMELGDRFGLPLN